ncbi:hypothetical protein EDB81DRAFT_757120 [Dactylonectria macrodidyma]|uniref:Uncharacterized protein n=1 Tax=Dactylonectria macrodidyma TaxID=307937 RepID=A0A9P9FAA8_9HYPO|nr:hypothetical protein EDB81DRAFT_757120 [Dactylonectria macrodidyma]
MRVYGDFWPETILIKRFDNTLRILIKHDFIIRALRRRLLVKEVNTLAGDDNLWHIVRRLPLPLKTHDVAFQSLDALEELAYHLLVRLVVRHGESKIPLFNAVKAHAEIQSRPSEAYFQHTQDILSSTLWAFVGDNGMDHVVDVVRKNIRYILHLQVLERFADTDRVATFTIVPSMVLRNGGDWLGTNVDRFESPSLPLRLLSSIQQMKNLQVLALDLHDFSDSQVAQISSSILDRSDKWTITSLKVFAAPQLSIRLIKHCDPGHLRRIHGDFDPLSAQYKTMARHHPKLQGVYLQMVPTDATTELGFLSTEIIRNDFREIKWLGPTTEFTRDILRGDMFGNGFSRHENAPKESLQGLTHLRFLSLTLFSVHIRHIVQNMNTPDNLTHHPGVPPITNDEFHTWYHALIHRIADALPRLQHVFILTAFPHAFRGIRSAHGAQMNVDAVQLRGCESVSRELFSRTMINGFDFLAS